MTVKVKTQYMSSFQFPQHCVACGGKPCPGTKEVSSSKSSGHSTTTLKLKFPLCEECQLVSKNSWLATLILVLGTLLGIGLIILGLMTYGLVGMYIGLGLLTLVILVLAWLSNLINQRGMTPEQRERRKIARRSVKISGFKAPGVFTKGWVTFKFDNATFANEFCAMNMGEIL